MTMVQQLRRARDAYERRDWMAAYDALSDSDPGSLRADDFARLATAALLLGRRNDSVQAMQRAYRVNVDAGERLKAVRCAFWLAMVLSQAGEPAVGNGWRARAERLVADHPGDVVERGYLLHHRMFSHLHAGELPEAAAVAERVADYGQRFSEPDLLAMGLVSLGRLRMYAGEVRAGIGLLDEAMVAVSTGELSPIFAGQIYCTMIEGCQEVSDFGRVVEWTRALTTWCAEQPDLVMFTGQCAVHRGQIMRLTGAWDEAVEELGMARERYLLADTPGAAGLALVEIGQVHLVRGDLASAEGAFDAALALGHDPGLGPAQLWQAQGRTAAALAAVRRLVAEPRNPVHRSQLLPGAVEILLAAGEVEEAMALARELDGLADAFGATGLQAIAGHTAAAVLLAGGAPDGASVALPRLRQAIRRWSELDADYEVARCRTLLGRAQADLGDRDSATVELTAAREVFRRLGARPAERRVDGLLRSSAPDGLTVRELEVLRLVAAGRSNQEIAAALVLSEKTVARHLSNIFRKLDVGSRTAATAYAFRHSLV